jgi:hypothetical protein
MQFTPMNAAKLIAQAYERKIKHNEDEEDHKIRQKAPFELPDGTSIKVKAIYDKNEAEAFALEGGILVIPGSDSVEDYWRYNLRGVAWMNLFRRKKRKFHKGFLSHAQEIHDFAKENGTKRITGHSLGAASSQLLASMLNVEALNFAAPKVVLRGWSVQVNKPIRNFNRKDDRVAKLPSFLWKHVGDTYVLDTKKPHLGGDHKIKHYETAMNMDVVQNEVPIRFT